jgi:hypothetical protein
MPNQRSENKRPVRGWFPKKLKEDLASAAKDRNIPESALLEEFVRLGLKAYKKKRRLEEPPQDPKP